MRFDFARFQSTSSFEFAVFGENARFGSARFEGYTWFASVNFGKQAWFDGAEFHQRSSFNRAAFNELAVFEASKFGDNANFIDAVFRKSASFGNVTFKGWPDFIGCQFECPTNFLKARFSTRFPNFHGTILHQSTTFTAKDECWPQTGGASAEQDRESLAIIRHAVGKQGLPEEEHYFYRREMAFAARIGSPLQRLPYQVFGALSDFGYSLAKPALWLASVWFVGLLAYTYWLTWLAPTLADAHPILTAAGFSVAQLFGFLGFTGSYFRADFLDALPTALKVLAGIQTVAGVVLLFFLGLGLRNRFRLK